MMAKQTDTVAEAERWPGGAPMLPIVKTKRIPALFFRTKTVVMVWYPEDNIEHVVWSTNDEAKAAAFVALLEAVIRSGVTTPQAVLKWCSVMRAL